MNVANNRKGISLFWFGVAGLFIGAILGFEIGFLVGQYLGR